MLRISMENRFRGFLPVAVDVETGGLHPETDALLEIAAVPFRMDAEGGLEPCEPISLAVRPFEGARIDPASLKLIGIDPYDPQRDAVSEREALETVFQAVRQAVREHHCQRAVLLGHNAAFDLAVVNAASDRCRLKRNPFHPFSTLDTVSLGAVAFGHTVLSRIAQQAGLGWDDGQAHQARYDAYKTAEVFCAVVNRWQGEYRRQLGQEPADAATRFPSGPDAPSP